MSDAVQARWFYVSGQVQGVGYRFFARAVAERLGIAGYVRNLADGRVEAYAVGTAKELDSFATELRRGPRYAVVEFVDVQHTDVRDEYSSDFVID
jgi:acylphosphatase